MAPDLNAMRRGKLALEGRPFRRRLLDRLGGLVGSGWIWWVGSLLLGAVNPDFVQLVSFVVAGLHHDIAVHVEM